MNTRVSNTEDSEDQTTIAGTSRNEDDMPLTMTHNAYMSTERAASFGNTVVTDSHDDAFGN